MSKVKTIIMGAAGRDFHNFNLIYRDNDKYDVVAFTATQIPDIDGRKYPAELAGKLYPNGIPIHPAVSGSYWARETHPILPGCAHPARMCLPGTSDKPGQRIFPPAVPTLPQQQQAVLLPRPARWRMMPG